MKKYVLITAARNEQNFIESTINSVIRQTIKPVKWIIVDDNSTDKTAEIVSAYQKRFDFIQLAQIKDQNQNRNFASKVYAINHGVKQLEGVEYDFIGILDADVTFDIDHYERILSKFEKNPRLGLAGGEFYDVYDGKLNPIFKSSGSVRGATAIFRRECFEDTGGFTPLKYGGEDAVIEAAARMHGWEVKSFTDTVILHHRRTGSETFSIWKRKFYDGRIAYSMGYHPLFQFLKSFHRFMEKPYILGGLFMLAGFFWSYVNKHERYVSNEFINHIRKEQLNRIKRFSIN